MTEINSSTGFVVGAIVIGFGFVIDVELNGVEGTIVELLGDYESEHKATGEMYTEETFVVQWQHQSGDECDPVGRCHLKLKKPPSVEGEEIIMGLFKVRGTKYSFEHYEQIKTEMLEDTVKELVEAE